MQKNQAVGVFGFYFKEKCRKRCHILKNLTIYYIKASKNFERGRLYGD